MSIQIKLSCPHCGNIISNYSKKGFQSLHTSIGIPYITCDSCQKPIRTGHKPFQDMSTFMKSFEILKISLNSLIIVGIFGSMIGFFLGWLINEYLIGTDKPFNVYVFSLTIFAFIALKVTTHKNWSKSVSKHIDENGDSILSSQYEHPDW
jgi:hypothetical protein